MAQKLQTYSAVFIIIKNEAGQILLQQRFNTGYLDGYYDFACSGHVDEGESIREAAVRELAEEIGLAAEVEDLRLVHINQNFIDRAYLNFTFVLDKWEGTPSIKEPEKCSDLRYFDVDALPEKCTLNVRVNQRTGFASELTYSKITPVEYRQLIGT